MSRLHNKNISLIDEVDTNIIDHENKHQSRNLIIMDDTDKLLLEGIYFKRKCMRNALNIYSPAGFLLGTVKESQPEDPFSCEAREKHQRLQYQKGNELIAKVTKSPSPTGQFWYTITYLKHVPLLQKILILCEVLSSCHKESESFVSQVSSKITDTLCCPLYYDSKIKFFILCIMFPLVIVVYLIFILVFVAYFIGTLFTFLIAKCYDSDTDLSCAFTWPCRLCANSHSCSEYCLCYKNELYCAQLGTVIICIMVLDILFGVLIYKHFFP